VKHLLRIAFIVFLTSVLVVDCRPICGCGPPPQAIFFIYYKSATNPDLLQPQTGLYSSSDIKIIEDINKNGTIVETPAPKIEGQYVRGDAAQPSRYYLHYVSSAIQNQENLKRTLIQLSAGVTDTLTYTFSSNNSYPLRVFYNSKSIWQTGDSYEITVVK